MRIITLCVVLLTVACSCAASLACTSKDHPAAQPHTWPLPSCSFPALGQYQPEQISQIDNLPPPIRMRLDDHLRSRLGDVLYSRIRFAGGRFIDAQELSERLTDIYFPGRPMPTYIIQYELPIGSPGFHRNCLDQRLDKPAHTAYCAQIELDRDGAVVSEITLPAAAKDPLKSRLISLATAQMTVAAHTYGIEPSCIQFGYDDHADSLVWHLSYPVDTPQRDFSRTVAVVSAHNSNLMGWITLSGGGPISGGPVSEELQRLLDSLHEEETAGRAGEIAD